MFSDTAAEAGILSFRKFAKTMPEAKYCYTSCRCIRKQVFPALYNGFAGGGKRKGIGYREMQCMGVQEWKITGLGKDVL